MTSLKKGPTRPEIASTQGQGEWAAWRGPHEVNDGKRRIYDLRMVYRSAQAGQILLDFVPSLCIWLARR